MSLLINSLCLALGKNNFNAINNTNNAVCPVISDVQKLEDLNELVESAKRGSVIAMQRLNELWQGPDPGFLPPAARPSLRLQSRSGEVERIKDSSCYDTILAKYPGMDSASKAIVKVRCDDPVSAAANQAALAAVRTKKSELTAEVLQGALETLYICSVAGFSLFLFWKVVMPLIAQPAPLAGGAPAALPGPAIILPPPQGLPRLTRLLEGK